ncbi:MAG: DUF1761 domain-containing protein [Parachlamydiales bacterium]|nr:DUF1761 domain-containing protein [Parachlamydiales bacterium]
MKEIDFYTVLFASVVYFIMYVLWHSNFLFKKIYEDDKKEKKVKEKKRKYHYYILVLILIFITSYVLASLEIFMKVTSFWDGVILGLFVWIGFVFPHSFFMSSKGKKNYKLFFLDNILYLLGLIIVGGILAG